MFDSYIDNSGLLQERYREVQQLDSCHFVVCTRGECRISAYYSEHTLSANSLITLLANSYVRVVSQAPETELYVISFKQMILSSAELFAMALELITHIIESPVIEFGSSSIEIMCEYNRLLSRIKAHTPMSEDRNFVSLVLSQFIVGIGLKYKVIEDRHFNVDRSRALVAKLTKLVVEHFKTERSTAFYADKMCITPQHLCSVVRQVTNRTVSDIIATFVIMYAQSRLASTDLSIGEIAAELHFEDISIFGRYFKRHTKISPRQYRKQAL